ncbi:DNA repair-scaffolding protein [Oopsacas minuta]|uniref:DNA repair-scaffolding protein n=1 Tax=Oopsacas minuta TaxID=111878 RepID=A0AAV7KHQ7_9METZ|nr:DNA repair-scaffolding protein [Oopsacas minuta]
MHVTHAVNPRQLSDTQVTEMNLDQHFQIFIRDSNDECFVVSLPIPILDKHDTIIKPYQLLNSIVLLKCVKVLSRVNKHTSLHLMSIIQTLSGSQRYCYILAGSLNSQIDILKDFSDSTAINPLTELSEYSTAEQRYRTSLVGRLQHTQLEVPISIQDGDIEEHSRPLSGCFLFLLGDNCQLFQVYVEPVLTRSLLHTLQESCGRIFYLGSIFVSRITERPTPLLADKYCNLIEIINAGLMLGSEMVDKVINKFSFVTPTSYPLFGEYYKVNSMVYVRGSIEGVVEECAYVWQVCGGCGEGVEEYSQGNEFYCDECQAFVTNPIDKFNLDLIIKCNNMEKTELIVHLHDDTIKKILPKVGEGKQYDKIELKGNEIEMESCFIQEKLFLPCGLTKVYLEEKKHILT